MILFPGYQVAAQKEQQLLPKVAALKQQGKAITIGAIVFEEDQGSMLYTSLKKAAAQRIGIEYRVASFSLQGGSRGQSNTNQSRPGFSMAAVLAQIQAWNQDSQITGIIIQKPWKQTWVSITGRPATEFTAWWHELVNALDQDKDVDGLHPLTLAAIKAGTWHQQHRVLPATCQAVIEVLSWCDQVKDQNDLNNSGSSGASGFSRISPSLQISIIGKSDLLGWPLFYYLKHQGLNVELLGQKDLLERIESKKWLLTSGVVVSATGRNKLITGEFIQPGTVVIDVGEPKGDVDQASVATKAAILTPVPGGVGPMTVVCLLENGLKLVQSRLEQ